MVEGQNIFDHEAKHESGGGDEIPSGSLTPQDPTAHEGTHEIGGADELGEWLSVKRDVSGSVVWDDIATGLTTTTTATSATVSTATSVTGQILFTQMSATATGGFTTATISLLRNGSVIATTTGGTGTTLVTSNSVDLTGTNTFTGALHLTAGTPGTLTFTARRDSRTTVSPR